MWFFIFIFIMSTMVQWCIVLTEFAENNYTDKKKFVRDLIPWYPVVRLTIEVSKNLSKIFKEAWSKLK